jgi:hypothetical protein
MEKYFKITLQQHNYRGELTQKRIQFPVKAENPDEASAKLQRVVARTTWTISDEEIRPCSKDEANKLLQEVMNKF